MRSFLCKICEQSFEKAKSYSNHIRYGCPIGFKLKETDDAKKIRKSLYRKRNYAKTILYTRNYLKEYRKSEYGKRKSVEGVNRYNKNHPERYKAKNVLKVAVIWGKIKKYPCEVCGDKKSEGHHEDYSKPLEVIWLCHKHHLIKHNHWVEV